jgi:predicted transcriptional regulator
VEAKIAVRELLERLPDDCTLEDVQYHLYVLQAIEQGLADVAAGNVISHEEVERELREKWILGVGA